MTVTTVFTPSSAAAGVPALHGALRLTGYGVIRAQGEDAATFLHGQLTNDFALLGGSEARLAAFCNAKGRMQASFVGYKAAKDDIRLVCRTDLLPTTLKRLSLFVLRAKARLTNASHEIAVWGVAGDAVPADLPAPVWSVRTDGDRTFVRLPSAAGVPRAFLCQPHDGAAPAAGVLTEDQWNWLEVQSAVPMLTQPLFELFVPQMLNYESVGGVNFKKGCYPGQEVVARSQFRGALKRRTYLMHAAESASPGVDVFHASDAEQACGTVVQCASHPAGAGFDLLVSMQTAAADGQPVTLGRPDGPMLVMGALPYALLADV